MAENKHILNEHAEQQEGAQRTLLKDKAYAEIKDRILDGRFSPGMFLAERWLADKLGMSKTPIRAAIGRLEAEGFVAVSPQQGIVVREMSFHEIVDYFDIRIALETFVVRRLAGRLTPAQQERLQENLEAQREHASAREVAPFVELDTNFHLMLSEFLNNQEILQVMTRERDKLYRIIFRVLQQDTSRLTSSCEEHAAIVDAVIDGDPDRAAELTQEHLEFGKRFLISS